MAALVRQGAWRIGGSVFRRTQAAVTSPAVAGERRRLLSRRAYRTEELDKEIRDRIDRMKRHELCWEVFKLLPKWKIFRALAGTYMLVALGCSAIALEAEKKLQK